LAHITRDKYTQDNPGRDRVRTHGAKMIDSASEDAGTNWTQLEVFMRRWREIDALVDQPGPVHLRGQSYRQGPPPRPDGM